MIELSFTNKKKTTTHKRRNDPNDLFRRALHEQINGVIAEQNGVAPTVKRFRFREEVDRPLRKWWWQTGSTYYLTLRYSSQIIRIRENRTILCGNSLKSVEHVLVQLLAALDNYDRDLIDAIEKAYQKTRWKKRPHSQR